MRLEELVSVREIRAVIKERFLEFKDVTDPRVSLPTLQLAAARPQQQGQHVAGDDVRAATATAGAGAVDEYSQAMEDVTCPSWWCNAKQQSCAAPAAAAEEQY